MASGDTLAIFTAQSVQPPSASFATFDVITGASNAQIPVLEFDGAASENADFQGVVPNAFSASPALTVRIGWTFQGIPTGGDQVRWTVAFKRAQDDTDDIDADAFATANEVSSTAPDAGASTGSGQVVYDEINFTNAEADGIQPGETFFVRLSRNVAHADDDFLGVDAQFLSMEIRQQ